MIKATRLAVPLLLVLTATACNGITGTEDENGAVGGDTGGSCPLPAEAPEATGDQELTVSALEALDTEGTGWSASARHDSDNDCLTVTIRTGGEEVPQEELESYRDEIRDVTGLEDVRVVQDDGEPDQLDN